MKNMIIVTLLKILNSLGLEKLKQIQSNGRLVLTENNIEKITTYLNIDRFLKAISSRQELTPEQIKRK